MLFAQSSPVGSSSLPTRKKITPMQRRIDEMIGGTMTSAIKANENHEGRPIFSVHLQGEIERVRNQIRESVRKTHVFGGGLKIRALDSRG
jgi:hypothetical protein